MKILQINNCHYRRGGADVVYLNTGELLSKKGHEVIYFSQKSNKNYETKSSKYFIDEINFFENSIVNKFLKVPRFFYSEESKKKLTILLKNEKPDLAHIHLYKGNLTSSILRSIKKFNIPIVLSMHDYGLLCPHNLFLDGKNEICEKCVGSTSLNCIINKCNHNNTILSTISAFEFIFNNSFFPFEKYFSKIITVSKFGYNKHIDILENRKNYFVHLYNFYPNLDKTKIESNKGNYFFFYGRLSKEKGVRSLLESWKLVPSNIKLKVAGTGNEMKNLEEFTKEEGLSNVEFLGHIEGLELMTTIKNSSYIIVPSEWYENNPLTVIEAYALGKPVIASNIGGLPEIVIENETGFLFEMKNKFELTKTINKADELTENEYRIMSENARNFAENNFNDEIHYQKLLEIYKEVINNKRN